MASYSYTITVSGPVSTSIQFIPEGTGIYNGPVPAGTTVGRIVVQPPEWSGVVTAEAPFTVVGDKIVNVIQLEIGTHSVAGQSNP